VDGSDETLNALAGVEEPEQKRQVIGRKFVDFFKRFEERTKFESDLISLDYLVQGTLYPDVIESCPPAGAEGRNLSHTIKSHHNVGGLPKDLGFKLVEPLRELFKDEVRQLGSIMGVPSWFLRRHPFPGPGLAVRVLGDVTVGNKLHMCREADKIFIDVLEEEGEYDNTWQAFAAILPVAAVGVQGDQRTRGAAVALRAITSTDGMTADWAPLSHSLLAKASARICNAIEGVNRVFYDVTSKPPSTVELE
jgi:GMP synthase (glutamine-hydrolysing)